MLGIIPTYKPSSVVRAIITAENAMTRK